MVRFECAGHEMWPEHFRVLFHDLVETAEKHSLVCPLGFHSDLCGTTVDGGTIATELNSLGQQSGRYVVIDCAVAR